MHSLAVYTYIRILLSTCTAIKYCVYLRQGAEMDAVNDRRREETTTVGTRLKKDIIELTSLLERQVHSTYKDFLVAIQ